MRTCIASYICIQLHLFCFTYLKCLGYNNNPPYISRNKIMYWELNCWTIEYFEEKDTHNRKMSRDILLSQAPHLLISLFEKSKLIWKLMMHIKKETTPVRSLNIYKQYECVLYKCLLFFLLCRIYSLRSVSNITLICVWWYMYNITNSTHVHIIDDIHDYTLHEVYMCIKRVSSFFELNSNMFSIINHIHVMSNNKYNNTTIHHRIDLLVCVRCCIEIRTHIPKKNKWIILYLFKE